MSENEPSQTGARKYLDLYSAEYHAQHLAWARTEGRIYRHYRDQYLALVQPKPGMKILELGCSSGKTTRIFAEKGCKVVSVDFDPHAIELARKWIADAGLSTEVEFKCCSADEVEIAGQGFDVITMLDFVEHVPDELLVSVLGKIRESKFDGTVCIYTPDRRHFTEVLREVGILHQDKTHINLKSLTEWRAFFESHGMRVVSETRAPSHWPVLSSIERRMNSLPGIGPWLIRSLALRLERRR
ncbi:MAG: class I SAM-dependent methyltransferase [Polyangiaceae bacterium]